MFVPQSASQALNPFARTFDFPVKRPALLCALVALSLTACGGGGASAGDAEFSDDSPPLVETVTVPDTIVDIPAVDQAPVASAASGSTSPVSSTQPGVAPVVTDRGGSQGTTPVVGKGANTGSSTAGEAGGSAGSDGTPRPPETSAGGQPTPGTSADTKPSVPAAATINTVDTVVNDMKLRNDLVLRGYENQSSGWYVGPGHVMMGNDPRLTNTPSWWKASNAGNVSSAWLQAMLPWVVIFDGAGHSATNTRVQIRNFRAYYQSKASGQWVSLGSSAGVGGAVYGKSTLFGATSPEERRTNSDGSSEIRPPSDINYAWHGWWSKGRVSINSSDIAALFVTLQARLVVDNPSRPDDRANARYLVQVGNDYYQDVATNWRFIVPSSMTSRSKLVRNQWQAFSATTFSNVGAQEPGGGITEAAFRAAPPPLE